MAKRARTAGFHALVAAVASIAGCDEGGAAFDEADADEVVHARGACIYGGGPPAVDTGPERFVTTGGCDLAVRQEDEPVGTQWGRLHVVAAIPAFSEWDTALFGAIVWSRQCLSVSHCGSWVQNAIIVSPEEGSTIGESDYLVQTLEGSVALPANHNSFRIGTRALYPLYAFTPVPVSYYFTES